MWSEGGLLALFVKVRRRRGRNITIPLLAHTGSLADLTDDYADALSVLPGHWELDGGGHGGPGTLGEAAGWLKAVPVLLRSLEGLKVNVRARDKEHEVHVFVKAL